jgi:site-specific DNA-methyltransferase (adenine-specific)
MSKLYNIIYADPPWHFGSKQVQKYQGKRFESIDKREYNTMSVKDICNLPVQNITSKDCALFLWVTDAHLKEGLEVISSWGFKYITIIFVWSKKTSNEKQVATLGPWVMKNCEICLFATKGKMLQYKKVNNLYQLVEAERTKHSKKPDEVRRRIEILFGDIPRIELFAREKTEGWDVWGNEVKSDIELEI